jgi:hypothetical protein
VVPVHKDVWTIQDALQDVIVFGQKGSGKTSASGRLFARKYLQAGFAGLVGSGYLQQRFAPRSPAGANLFFQQLVQFEIHLGELISVQLRQLLDDLLRAHFSLLPDCLPLAARVLRINSLLLLAEGMRAKPLR